MTLPNLSEVMSVHVYAVEALGYVGLGFVNAIVRERAGAEFDGRDAVVKVFEAVHAVVYDDDDGHVDDVEYGAAVEAAVEGIEGEGTAGTVGVVVLGGQSTEGNVVVADAENSFSAVTASRILRPRMLKVYLFHRCLGSLPPLLLLGLGHGWLTCIVCCFGSRGR